MVRKIRHHVVQVYAVVLVLAVCACAGRADTYVWTGAGGDGQAANSNNWLVGGNVPAQGPGVADEILLDGTSVSNVTWGASAAHAVAGWTQTSNYTGTVTFGTTYPEYDAAFTNVTVGGDVVLAGGAWSHLPQGNNTNLRRYRLRVVIDGNLTFGTNATVDVDGLGQRSADGETHGGQPQRGDHGGNPGNVQTFGRIRAPIELGDGGIWGNCNVRYGGGAMHLTVGGTSTVHGALLARSDGCDNSGHGAGGSIFLETDVLVGDGLMDASSLYGGAGGGRVAVIVRAGVSFGNVTMQAFGGNGGGAAGTVYREHAGHAAGQGELVIDNDGLNHGQYLQPYFFYASTLMPAVSNGGPVDLDAFAAVIVTNRGILGINKDTSFAFGTNLHLYGHNSSYISIRGTNGIAWPASLVVTNYTLLLDTPVHVVGDWQVTAGGRIAASHSRPSQNFSETSGFPWQGPLTLWLDGNLTVHAGAEVTVQKQGYFSENGPANQDAGSAASHGGQGGDSDANGGIADRTYGSILQPNTSGSGGEWGGNNFSPGGGRMRLVVSGHTQLDGVLNARPVDGFNPRAAGGSIWFTSGTLAGTGRIDARGRDAAGGDPGGGGGRIAVYLTAGTDVGGVDLRARGGNGSPDDGAAGTIYLETATEEEGVGTIRVDNVGNTASSNTVTQIPPSYGELVSDAPPVYGPFDDVLEDTTLVLVSNAVVQITSNSAFRALFVDDTSLFDLGGVRTTLRSRPVIDGTEYRAGVYSAADFVAAGTDAVIDSSPAQTGELVVPAEGSVITLQ